MSFHSRRSPSSIISWPSSPMVNSCAMSFTCTACRSANVGSPTRQQNPLKPSSIAASSPLEAEPDLSGRNRDRWDGDRLRSGLRVLLGVRGSGDRRDSDPSEAGPLGQRSVQCWPPHRRQGLGGSRPLSHARLCASALRS